MKRYNCATLPSELRAKQSAKWNVPGAISELIDNSLGKGRGDADNVTIYHDTKRRTLSVLDDGAGMEHIGALFQGGSTIGRVAGDIGEFGCGGTLALLWLASKVEIWTLRDGKVMHDSVVWHRWFRALSFDNLDVSDDWVRATVVNTPPELLTVKHGTFIRMHLLPGRIVNPAHVIKELSFTYSPGLRNGKRLTWIGMRRGDETDDTILTDPHLRPGSTAQSVDINFTVEYGEHLMPVRGKVFYDESTPVVHSRIYIGYGHRVVFSTKDCFNSRNSDSDYSGVGVSGWLDLGDEWKEFLTVTKDGINLDDLRDALMDYVFADIEPLLKLSSQDSLTAYIADLQLGIMQGLKSRPGPYEAELILKAKRKPRLVNPDPEPRPEPEPNPDPEPRTPRPPKLIPDEDGTKEMPAPAASYGLTIRTETDDFMSGNLCIAEVGRTSISIYVNKEHQAVHEALKAKPINRMALYLLTLGELANCVADRDDAHEILKSWFPPESLVVFEDVPPGRATARQLARFLMDRVRNPIPDDEAA